MATVDPAFASWLKSDARYVSATVAGADGKWSAVAGDSDVITPLATQADARTVAAAQATALQGPLVRDVVTVPGLLGGLIGQCVRINGDRLGYEGGANVFVVGASESDGPQVTTLTVLKAL